MSTNLALLLCFGFVLYVLWTDKNDRVSAGLWIPLVWFLLICSRPIELWINQEQILLTEEAYEEGSLWNRIIYPSLTLVGLIVLVRRRPDYGRLVRDNIVLLCWFGFCGLSIMWSDYPFISFKRWVKVLCAVVMVLVAVSESDPIAALRQLVRRTAYILVPFSIVLIKYVPDLGLAWSPWGDGPYMLGVTDNKNGLGRLCLITGFFIFYEFVAGTGKRKKRFTRLMIHGLYAAMIGYLLVKSNCATGATGLALGIGAFLFLKLPVVRRNIREVVVAFPFVLYLVLMMLLFTDVPDLLLNLLGRDSTLTTRTFLWQDLLDLQTPFFNGVGYDSFWLGPRLTALWDKWWWKPNEAHNGYLEIYLELGVVGVLLFLALLFSVFARVKRFHATDYGFFSFTVAFLLIFMLYNVTEVAIKGLNSMFFAFLLVAIQCRTRPGPAGGMPLKREPALEQQEAVI